MMWKPRIAAVLLVLALAPAAPAGSEQAPADSASDPASNVPPAPTCAERIAQKVQSHYDGVRDLSADFTQTSQVASLGSGPGAGAMQASGRVVFAKPGRMRWSYERPEPSLVLTDGRTLWTWDPGLGEAQHVAVGEGFLSGAAIQFLIGDGDVLESFAVESDTCEGERVTLRLLPYDAASYEHLLLEVDPANGRVHATEVVDLFGNATRVAFSKIRVNTGPADDLFRFEPPKGARVIEVPAVP
jgi:outer membrane lipoprotein carrier protein